MLVSANLLSPGVKIKVGQNQYELLEVAQVSGSITRVVYKNNKGITRSKNYKANDKVKII